MDNKVEAAVSNPGYQVSIGRQATFCDWCGNRISDEPSDAKENYCTLKCVIRKELREIITELEKEKEKLSQDMGLASQFRNES